MGYPWYQVGRMPPYCRMQVLQKTGDERVITGHTYHKGTFQLGHVECAFIYWCSPFCFLQLPSTHPVMLVQLMKLHQPRCVKSVNVGRLVVRSITFVQLFYCIGENS